MKYLKGNPELLLFTIIIYCVFVICTCIFLNIIPTGIELKMDEFNGKTVSVIGMLVFGFSTWGLTKLLKNEE